MISWMNFEAKDFTGPNTSPQSAQVLLTRKKDNDNRLYIVDKQALRGLGWLRQTLGKMLQIP